MSYLEELEQVLEKMVISYGIISTPNNPVTRIVIDSPLIAVEIKDLKYKQESWQVDSIIIYKDDTITIRSELKDDAVYITGTKQRYIRFLRDGNQKILCYKEL